MNEPRTFIPFDPDAFAGSGVTVHAEPEGVVMLSEVVEQQDWHAPEAEDFTGENGDNRDTEPGTSKPLDNVAKWRLSDLAERAYGLMKSRGLLAGETLEGYRRRVSIAACGKRISQASLGDRFRIQSAFLKEMDRAKAAAAAVVKAEATGVDIALFKLGELCRLKRYPANYGEGIAWRFYKKPLHELTAKQVWRVFFTINNNANQRDGKGDAANRFKSRKAGRMKP